MITKNSLDRTILLSTSKPIVLKERNGDIDTRIFIKFWFPTGSLEHYSDYILYNPQLNMYVFYSPPITDKFNKDYDINEELNYYVSLRPTSKKDTFEVKVNSATYDTKERNTEGIGNSVILNDGKGSSILFSPINNDENILVEIQSCDNSKLNFEIFNRYENFPKRK